jgi:hypothetical protein
MWTAGTVALGLAVPLTPAGHVLSDSVQKAKVQLVKVVNDPKKPVPVRDVEQPARRFFREALSCFAAAGETGCSSSITIPAGQILVIETLSAFANGPAGQQPSVTVTVGLLQEEVGFSVPLELLASAGGIEFFGALNQVRIYAGPGDEVELLMLRPQISGTANANLAISGHLVDCGAGPGCPVP